MSVDLTTLPNGLRILTDSMPNLETTSLGIWVGVGSRHETRAEHGLSHFLEHMAFKGTRRRSARRIAEEIESAGGDLNAATSTEQTTYYARVLAADTGLALDILADILTESVFDPIELEREKDVVLQEIGAVDDTPDDLVFEVFTATAFPDQPIGRAILGTPDGVSGFDRDAIARYLAAHYNPSAMIVGAAGALEHDRIVEDAEKRFGGMAAQAASPAVPAVYKGGEQRIRRKIEQAHLVIGWEGPSFNDPTHYAAHVFSHAAGGGMSSRLFQDVRENRGLAYSIYTFDWAYADTGLFGFYAATAPKHMGELLPVSLDCLAGATATLTEEEVERAKAQLKVSVLVALESSGARAEQIARQHLAFGRIIDRHEVIAKIDAIGVEDARRAGLKMLQSAPTVVSVGPTKGLLTPDQVMARLGSTRG
ncbi:insulinase family protein [Lichenihabitans sp. PAMC28606]|uniref:M16 family metallopeptidase n=1 Tax=Lichenihabitans sp. PAMC28606 TaxID=2880932 RepID=UPI001D0AF989|nr:pitrilysin family protein [Lichenihabitans sp. PAMC28606]UDL96111.1 insulinase family protein [Lichenihabitans sp. PAMC28606]